MMWLFFSILPAVLLLNTAQSAPSIKSRAQPINCAIWSSNPTGHEPCVQVIDEEFPLPSLDIYHVTDGWHNTDLQKDVLETVKTVTPDVLHKYWGYSGALDVRLILGGKMKEADLGTEWTDAATNQCWVRIRIPRSRDDEVYIRLKETVAHELYHCVEDEGRPLLTENNGTIWWLEGAAAFFGHLLYPNRGGAVNLQNYQPNAPLYKQTYPTALFFQFLSNFVWPTEHINDWIRKQPPQPDDSKWARGQLSSDAKMREVFPNFAARFVDRQITFADGTPVRTINEVYSDLLDVTLASDGAQATKHIQVGPWAMQMLKVTLHVAERIELEFRSGDPNTMFQYRQVGAAINSWNRGFKTPQVIHDGCDEVDKSYEFLVTSTADVDIEEVDFVFTRKKLGDCKCKRQADGASCPSVPAEVDKCLFGKWSLDIPTIEAALRKKYQELGAPVNSVAVTGAATFEVTEPDNSHFTFDHMRFNVVAASSLYSVDMDVTGNMDAKIVIKGDGEFVLKDEKSTGSVVTKTTFGDFTIPLDESITAEQRIEYLCSGEQLRMAAYDGPVEAWQYSYTRL
ncbi:hypothetical protein H2201_009137 [Coniosporium apollinis]|uniref:Uncharacterized protein n=1 Tax=Coniosporium apollinis TaxID=61459 RepID=A0ABQ9NGG4_9PEZI|nr:hypothetical protein H2201_009137 [Coniosporium apollinis]